MRATKRLISIILVCAICFCLSACGISKEDAVDTWCSTYEYDGDVFEERLVLDADGDYAKATYINGSLSNLQAGTWNIKNGKVVLHAYGNTDNSVVYSYKDGALVNNKHKFYGGISKEYAVGTWSGTYEYDGNVFAVEFILDANGDYAKMTYKNGSLSSIEEGTWEIDIGKVALHKDGITSVSTVYFYSGGALVNNSLRFNKE